MILLNIDIVHKFNILQREVLEHYNINIKDCMSLKIKAIGTSSTYFTIESYVIPEKYLREATYTDIVAIVNCIYNEYKYLGPFYAFSIQCFLRDKNIDLGLTPQIFAEMNSGIKKIREEKSVNRNKC